jgi:hypothetical protein
MPVRVWSHICDYAAIDASGKPTIVGEFDRIYAPAFPMRHPFFFVISKWSGSIGETFTHRVRVSSPNRQVLAESAETTITMRGEGESDSNHIAVDAFMMLEFPKSGEYSIDILINKLPVHVLRLAVSQAQPKLQTP